MAALLAVATLSACAASLPAAAPGTPALSAPTVRSTDLPVEPRPTDAAFADWVAGMRERARDAGIDETTLAAAFADVRYLPQVIALDRAQPEFTRTVWDYLDSAVSPRRVALGREKLAAVRGAADAAAARYGVPATILVAIWGLESNFGANTGDIPTIDALATLGFEGRREAWARTELLAALRILQHGDIDRAHMIGSWAGAMGQTQFLPSNFLAHAVDAAGDGRRDIWSSIDDVMASTANFLARSGWKANQAWGAEVRLPPGFDPGRADAVRQSSARWAAEGVRAVGEAPLPDVAEGSVLLPAGARGPAFLVGGNFAAILRYNNSTSYALAVGLLAQRLAGDPEVQAPWPRELKALTRSELVMLQSALNARGFDSGTPDGIMGPATRDALRRYQRSIDLPADGYPERELLRRLSAP